MRSKLFHISTIGYLAILCLLLASCGGAASPASTPTPEAAAPTVEAVAPTVEPTAAPTTAEAPTAAAPTAAATSVPPLARTLQLENPPLSGDDVRAVQTALLGLGYRDLGEADGFFGAKTEAAVRRFQRLNGLETDGVVGPRTWDALNSPAAQRGDETAEDQIALIVDAGFGGWLIGAGGPEGWLPPEVAVNSSQGGEPYTLYNLTGVVSSATGSAAQPEEPNSGPCSHLYTVELGFEPDPSGSRPIAVSAPWNPLPRMPELIDVEDTTYVELVAEWLRAKDIAEPDVRIEQIARVDLEGDGEAEVLIGATRSEPPPDSVGIFPGAGDYSFVIMRKVVDGVVQTIPLIEEYYPEATEERITLTNQFLALLDLNGDGTLEVVVSSAYYEGASTLVYEVQGTTINEVLGVGCGA